jgi:hypothetical protein
MFWWTVVSQTLTVAHSSGGLLAASAGNAATAQQAMTRTVPKTRIIEGSP